MFLQKFYSSVCTIVCRELDLSVDELLHCRREKCSDGRYILVALLGEYMTDEEIAECSGLSRSGANKIRNGFAARKRVKFSVRCEYERLKYEVRKLSEAS